MSKQWGHGFHTGKQHGERWGALLESGKWEIKMGDISDRLILIANALRMGLHGQSQKTDTWWSAYVSAAAKEICKIASELPGRCANCIEFEKDIPKDSE